MSLRSLGDIVAAVQAGRHHAQLVYKSTSGNALNTWLDWSYASGRPAYDARIGAAGQFNPVTAAGNDAIYFPSIPAGQERQLMGVTMRPVAGATAQTNINFEVYDLLGVYPLIDGDSTDLQTFTNAAPLPRYADGVGVEAVIVNHVAPILAAATAQVSYTDDADIDQSVTWRLALTGLGQAAYTAGVASSTAGPLYCNKANGSRGIKRINSIQFSSTPGGLFCIYLVKPIMSFTHVHDVLSAGLSGSKVAVQKCNCMHSAMKLPRILDGAHLGMFFMPGGAVTNTGLFGHFDFIWG